MKTLKSIMIIYSFLLLMFCNFATAKTVLYEINGNFSADLKAFSDDAIADLLGIQRNSEGSIPFSIRLLIDAESFTPFINETSVVQQAEYGNAIISMEININGTTFETIRGLNSDIPNLVGVIDEGNIMVVNQSAQSAKDSFRIIVGFLLGAPPGNLPLFNSYNVPYNLTLAGEVIKNAKVEFGYLSVNYLGENILDGLSIPTQDGLLSSIQKPNLVIQLISTFDSSLPFQITTNLRAEENTTIVITTVTTPDQSNDECIAIFESNGSLKLPCVSVPDGLGGTDLFSVEMKLIPSSIPVSFSLTGQQHRNDAPVSSNCLSVFKADGSLTIPCVNVTDSTGSAILFEAKMKLDTISKTIIFQLTQAQQKK